MAFTEEIILKAKDEASKSINNVNSSMDTLKKTTIAAGAVFTAGAMVITDWTKEAINAEMIYKSLESAVKRNSEAQDELNLFTGQSEGVTKQNNAAISQQVEELKQLAFGLQEVSVFSGDSIVQAQAILSNYGMTTEQLKEMSPVLVDLASKMSMMSGKQVTMTEAANVYGKALTGSSMQMKRFGIDLTENGKSMTDHNAILAKVREQTVGASADFANTAVGSLAQLKNAYDDLKRDLGMSFLPILKDVVELGIKPMVDFMNSLDGNTKKYIATGVLLTTALSGIVLGLGTLGIVLAGISATMLTVIGYVTAFTAGIWAAYEALSALAEYTGIFDKLGSIGVESVELSDEAKQKQKQLGLNKNNNYNNDNNNSNENSKNNYENFEKSAEKAQPKPKIYNGITEYMSELEESGMGNGLIEAGILG